MKSKDRNRRPEVSKRRRGPDDFGQQARLRQLRDRRPGQSDVIDFSFEESDSDVIDFTFDDRARDVIVLPSTEHFSGEVAYFQASISIYCLS